MSGKVNSKKAKSTQFHHARDNAIASLGKVLKYQKGLIQSNSAMYEKLTQFWISLLPITHDVEEAQLQFQFLAEFVVQEPEVIFKADPQAAVTQVVKIMAEAFQEKFIVETNKLAMANCVRYLAQSANAQFMAAYQHADMNDDLRARIELAFNFQG